MKVENEELKMTEEMEKEQTNETRLGSVAERTEFGALQNVSENRGFREENSRTQYGLFEQGGGVGTPTTEQIPLDRNDGNGHGSIQEDDSLTINRNSALRLLNSNDRKDFRFNNLESFYSGTKLEKINNNIEALTLLKTLKEDSMVPTEKHQNILAQYVGWGGLQEVFSTTNPTYAFQQNQLKEILTEVEYESAMESVLTSYYTDPRIIESLYTHLENQGFQGGRVLDPSMGTGNYFSAMPDHFRNKTERIGIELDRVTGQIAEHLHGNSEIHVKGFEHTELPEKSFDLVISNIPFSNYHILDEKYDQRYLVHEYFIKKSLDLTADGGIICFISSTGFMDKVNGSFRSEVNQVSDFKGAIRLPNTAFRDIAGTKVTTDIVFFQKNEEKIVQIDNGINNSEGIWLKRDKVNDDRNLPENEMQINKFFVDNPLMMLGNPKIENYQGKTFSLDSDGSDLIEQLNDALAVIDLNIQHPIDFIEPEKKIEIVNLEFEEERIQLQNEVHSYRPYSYVIGGEGNLFYLEGSEFVYEEGLSRTDIIRAKAMVELRDRVDAVIEYQMTEDAEDGEHFKTLLENLNVTYDEFVKKHEFISNRNNIRAFKDDDTYHLLSSLEVEDFENKGLFTKADIFFKPTISRKKEYTTPTTHFEALEQSMSRFFKVDMEFICSSMNSTVIETYETLKGLVFINHETFEGDVENCDWILGEEYLSGDVITKRNELRVKSQIYNELEDNLNSINEVLPTPIEAKDISFSIGSRWIPLEVLNNFMYEIFDINHSYKKGGWRDTIEILYRDFSDEYIFSNKNARTHSIEETFGTKRKNGYELLTDSLNLRQTIVYDRIDDFDKNGKPIKRSVQNADETIFAQHKQDSLQNAFKEWIFENPEIADELVTIYNETYNRFVNRSYDGSNIEIDGMISTGVLQGHQKNVIARIITEGRVLMAHEVGAGKTLSMIGAGFKMKDLGLINKPLYVVPKHLVGSFAKEMVTWFPNRKVLTAEEDDFSRTKRLRMVSKIATGDYDAIVIGHTQFEKIPLSLERQENWLRDEIKKMYDLKEHFEYELTGKSPTVKAVVSARKKLETQLERLLARDRKDFLLDFEELGVDFIFVDESHNFKNLESHTRLSNVAGIGDSASQRAQDMYMKTQYLFEKHGYRGVVHATGTPISNSMVELHTQMRYIMPDFLEKHNLSFLDRWISTFGDITSEMELHADSTRYTIRPRLSGFKNLPEIMTQFSLHADIQTQESLNLDVPLIRGGKPHVIVSERSEIQDRMMEDIELRSEKISGGGVDPSEDNMLKITHEARSLAIDPRLLDPSLPVGDSKISGCAEKVFEIWENTRPTKASQLVFSDLGVPRSDDPDRFNVYTEMKLLLVEKGIPSEEIAFIHDYETSARKEMLFDQVRYGEVRVLLGSTSKLGTGTNVQRNLVATHHIDCPWRPSDIIQRDGRIVRQGNTNKEVDIYRYVTKGTFDAFMWQVQEQKSHFIEQVMTNRSPLRVTEDLETFKMNAAEVKALSTGNPMFREKMEVERELSNLNILKANFNSAKVALTRAINKTIPEAIATQSKIINDLEKDIPLMTAPDKLVIKFGDQIFTDFTEAGKEFNTLANGAGGEKVRIGSYGGFDIITKRGFSTLEAELVMNGTYKINVSRTPTARDIRNIVDYVENMPNLLESNMEKVVELQKELEQSIQSQSLIFEHDDKIEELESRLEELNVLVAPVSRVTEDNAPDVEHSNNETSSYTRTLKH